MGQERGLFSIFCEILGTLTLLILLVYIIAGVHQALDRVAALETRVGILEKEPK